MEESIFRIFPLHLRDKISKLNIQMELLEEIRIRVQKPLIFQYANSEWFLDKSTYEMKELKNEAYIVSETDIEEMVTYLSRYSIYAFEDDVKNGFLTLAGGHRVGVAGHVVMAGGKVLRIQNINFLNIRVARERKGCAKKILPYLLWKDSIFNALISSPPGIGKTTFLRDCIRMLSDGSEIVRGQKICVIDERSELAACERGIPQNDLGIRTDVIDACGKAEGMLMALRSMSPQIIAVDELGDKEDFKALEQIVHCGSRILGTIHADDIEDLKDKLELCCWKEKNIFKRYILLGKKENGTRSFEVFDENMEKIW